MLITQTYWLIGESTKFYDIYFLLVLFCSVFTIQSIFSYRPVSFTKGKFNFASIFGLMPEFWSNT